MFHRRLHYSFMLANRRQATKLSLLAVISYTAWIWRGFAGLWKIFPVRCKGNFRVQVSSRAVSAIAVRIREPEKERMPRIFFRVESARRNGNDDDGGIERTDIFVREWIIIPGHRWKWIPPILNSLRDGYSPNTRVVPANHKTMW